MSKTQEECVYEEWGSLTGHGRAEQFYFSVYNTVYHPLIVWEHTAVTCESLISTCHARVDGRYLYRSHQLF